MALSASTSLNKVLDEDTFDDLATIVATRVSTVPAAEWTGPQKFNSVPDAFTVDTLVAHLREVGDGSLPSSSGILGTDRLNGSIDTMTVGHVVKFLVDEGISIAVPVNSVAPTIAGTGTGPFNVTDEGTWSNDPDSYTYQWQADEVDIDDETSDTLADDVAYDGVSITCLVAGVNEVGEGTAVASNAIVGAA